MYVLLSDIALIYFYISTHKVNLKNIVERKAFVTFMYKSPASQGPS